MPSLKKFKISIQNRKTDHPVSQNWISEIWKNFKSRTGCHMLISLKTLLKYSTRGYVYLKRRMIRSHKSIIRQQIKIRNCMNWMKSWTSLWNKWSRKCKALRRNTKKNWINSLKNVVSATTWLRWTFQILQWLMIKWMWALTQPLTRLQPPNLLFSKIISSSNNSSNRVP